MEQIVLRFIACPEEASRHLLSALELSDGSWISLSPSTGFVRESAGEHSSVEPAALLLPDPVDLERHRTNCRPDTIEFWQPVAEGLAFKALAPLVFMNRPGTSVGPDTGYSIPKTKVVSDCLAAISEFERVAGILQPAWAWVQPDLGASSSAVGGRRTTTLPPVDLLPSLTRAAEQLEDSVSRLMVLGVAHAIGQEASFLHAGWGYSKEDRSEVRQKHWYSVQQCWLKYLEERLECTVEVRAVLTGQGDWERFASSWLPVASLRAVSVQLKRNLEGRAREDFVTRIGMALPWADQTRWATFSRAEQGTVFCDAWPHPLDHLLWWQSCLEAIALKLFQVALQKGMASPLRVIDLQLPFYRQSLAATLAVARPLGQNQGKGSLTAACALPLEAGAAPNYLIPHLARLIPRPRNAPPADFSQLADDPSNVAEGVATPAGPGFTYPNFALVLPNAKPDLEATVGGIKVSLSDAGRNLGRDVKWAVGTMREFQRFQRREAEMFLWWRDLLVEAPTSLEFAFGSGWVWNHWHTMETLTSEDYPPSARCKLGWLAWVIAMWARNDKLPANLPVPSTEELDAVGVEDELSNEAKDVMAQRGGTPDEMDPYHGQRRLSRGRPLRILALQGWFGKVTAQERILQWLANHQPQQGKSLGFFFSAVCCSIAAARRVHELRDPKLIGVLSHLQKVAETLEDHDAANGAAWLHSYLSYAKPFPKK